MDFECSDWSAVHDKEPGADEGGPALIITGRCGDFRNGGYKFRLQPREDAHAGRKEAYFDLVVLPPEETQDRPDWARVVYREATDPRAKLQTVRIFHDGEERWSVPVEVIK